MPGLLGVSESLVYVGSSFGTALAERAASALVVISACLTLLSKDTCPLPGKLTHCVARWHGRAAALSVSGTEGLRDESGLAQEDKAEL